MKKNVALLAVSAGPDRDPNTLEMFPDLVVKARKKPLTDAQRAKRHREKKNKQKAEGKRAALDLKGPELAVLGLALCEFRERWRHVPSKCAAVEALLRRVPMPSLAETFPGDSAWSQDSAQCGQPMTEWQRRAETAEAELAHIRCELEQLGQSVRAERTAKEVMEGLPLELQAMARELGVAATFAKLVDGLREKDRQIEGGSELLHQWFKKYQSLERQHELETSEGIKARLAVQTLTNRLKAAGLPTDYRKQSGE